MSEPLDLVRTEHCVCHVLGREGCRQHSYVALETALHAAQERVAALEETVEAMRGDAADLIDCMDEAAVTRTALAHVLIRTHDSGCGVCDAARALLLYERPSLAALSATETPEPSRGGDWEDYKDAFPAGTNVIENSDQLDAARRISATETPIPASEEER